MKIVFMGSGDFALPTLEKLYSSNHDVGLVLTTESAKETKAKQPILDFVTQNKLNHIVATKINTDLVDKIRAINPDIIVVVSYGVILSKDVLQIGKFPAINLHPSALPRWRGAAPIERAIESGDTDTAIAVIQMSEQLDAGNIVQSVPIEIFKDETGSALRQRCAKIGSDIVLSTLNKMQNEEPLPTNVQSQSGITYASKIQKQELLLNLESDILTLGNKIRAFDGVGGCYFEYKQNRIKILKATTISTQHNQKCGTIDPKNGYIYVKNGILKPEILQKEGRSAIEANSFWRGFKQ